MTTQEWMAATQARLQDTETPAQMFPLPAGGVTQAARGFFDEHHHIIHLLILLVEATAAADNAYEMATVLERGETPTIPPKLVYRKEMGVFGQRLSLVSFSVVQMVVSRLIDNLTTYIVEIIADCLRSRPEIMRSDEKVTYEAVFRADTLEQLKEELIDRKVNDLAYYGFEKLAEWLDTKIGRGGSVCLNSYRGLLSGFSALVMPLPGLASAH